jgi:catechol 2,3-dioxygenase-like lactoylglutathione lyase family enzyme
MKPLAIDHLVLTVASIEKSVEFYTSFLGFKKLKFGEGRIALQIGYQKINLHECGKEFTPHAASPTAGSGDLCFEYEGDILKTKCYLESSGLTIIAGPLERTGARGRMQSLYIRDPDENLVELGFYE